VTAVSAGGRIEPPIAAARAAARDVAAGVPMPQSSYNGVAWNRQRGMWCASLSRLGQGSSIFLGYFADEEEGARRWDQEARKNGRTALNFPSTGDEETQVGIPAEAASGAAR